MNEKQDNRAALQAFERAIVDAHQDGTLFYLAVELAAMLYEHYGKYGRITARELENFIARAAEKMSSEAEQE